MTASTSLLVGLWMAAAISNTSHSNKTGSTTVKRAWLTGKYQGRRDCCHNNRKIFPISLKGMNLYFPDTPRILLTTDIIFTINIPS
jgi:hypothetical protein